MLRFHNTYATLDARLYHKQPPTALANPQAGHFNCKLAARLGWLDDDFLMTNWVAIIGGKIVPNGFAPLAMAYAGHQFGQWAGQLGDGRGLLMAQVLDSDGRLTDLHLKGAGLTPYSRMGDGRAVIRSVVREYLAGHALNALGIRASNALGFVISDTPVRRERMERGAALLRTADSHIRFGHVEWIAAFAPDLLLPFTRYVIATYFDECLAMNMPITAFLQAVVDATAQTLAAWQLVGFAHGVMNTDNLSITGATLDFGPFGMMERFNPMWINNHSDYNARYVYQNQPSIALWNLSRLITHFLRLDGLALSEQHAREDLSREVLTDILDSFGERFYAAYERGLCQKFGLPVSAANAAVALRYLDIMQQHRLDYTNSLRALLAIASDEAGLHEQALLATLNNELAATPDGLAAWRAWQADYRALNPDAAQISQYNPVYVLRNSMAQAAIERAEQGDMDEVARLFDVLATPYTVSPLARPEDTQPPAPDAAEICVSCSS
ncbi:YdiU family protein [Moraxella atlantae]|uniref:protein adenylyltransferase SelO n=1 Tax=Faucicola atlantae TaxID=34059 RepID=UPI00375054D9